MSVIAQILQSDCVARDKKKLFARIGSNRTDSKQEQVRLLCVLVSAIAALATMLRSEHGIPSRHLRINSWGAQ